MIPPAYLTPVGDLAGVNALDFLYAQSCDRVAAVDEKDEGFPADGGQVEGHTQRFRLRQLIGGGRSGKDQVGFPAHQALIGVDRIGAGNETGIGTVAATGIEGILSLRPDRLDKGGIDRIKCRGTVEPQVPGSNLVPLQCGWLWQYCRTGVGGKGLVVLEQQRPVIQGGKLGAVGAPAHPRRGSQTYQGERGCDSVPSPGARTAPAAQQRSEDSGGSDAQQGQQNIERDKPAQQGQKEEEAQRNPDQKKQQYPPQDGAQGPQNTLERRCHARFPRS